MFNRRAASFYDSIAAKYHWFFSSWDEVMKRQMEEIVPLLREHRAKTVLDCSCGTGLQAIGLAKEGFLVTGSDLSGRMLDVARENAAKEGIRDITFLQSDFREIRSRVNGSFDVVISMGNSIPHLMNESDLSAAFGNIRECLKEGGIAVFEIRNYDEMLAKKQRFLPMRINAEKDGKIVSVLYVFDYFDSFIRFNIVYLVEDKMSGAREMDVEIVDYNPIKSAAFEGLLKEAGFADICKKESGTNLFFTAVKPRKQ